MFCFYNPRHAQIAIHTTHFHPSNYYQRILHLNYKASHLTMKTEQHTLIEKTLKGAVLNGHATLESLGYVFESSKDTTDTAWIKKTLKPFLDSTKDTDAILKMMASEAVISGITAEASKLLKEQSPVIILQRAYESEMMSDDHVKFGSSTIPKFSPKEAALIYAFIEDKSLFEYLEVETGEIHTNGEKTESSKTSNTALTQQVWTDDGQGAFIARKTADQVDGADQAPTYQVPSVSDADDV